VLFKISYPAEFHAQTAVECAAKLHADIQHRMDEIERIEIRTHESAIRIISKEGPLHNPADRDHCLQYMVAVALLTGHLTAADYEEDVAQNPQIDKLRAKMVVTEDLSFSKDYHDPQKRSIANALRVIFKTGEETDWVIVEYPIGHARRREEGIPVLIEKCRKNLATQFAPAQVEKLIGVMRHLDDLCDLSVPDFMEMWINPHE
jgi:2-methylcitrate dehydratase